MTHLFAYGTLMCEDIMQEVSGCCLSHEPGTLRGYSRRVVKGEHYPALVPYEPACVDGLVYRELPASAWERLDRFEGEMYCRQEVQVELADGRLLPAATYVARPEFLAQIGHDDWDFAGFLRRGKKLFQAEYREPLSG